MDTDSLYQFEDLGLSNNIQWDKNSSFEICPLEIIHTYYSNSIIQQQAKTYLDSTEAKKLCQFEITMPSINNQI